MTIFSYNIAYFIKNWHFKIFGDTTFLVWQGVICLEYNFNQIIFKFGDIRIYLEIIFLASTFIVWFGLVWFYGISTIVGYVMTNPFYTSILNIYDLQTHFLITFLNDSIRVRVDLVAMVMKGYSTFPKAPGLECHPQTVSCHIQETDWKVLPVCRDAVSVFYRSSWRGPPTFS